MLRLVVLIRTYKPANKIWPVNLKNIKLEE